MVRHPVDESNVFDNKIRKLIYGLIKKKPRYCGEIQRTLNKNIEKTGLRSKISRQLVFYHIRILEGLGFIVFDKKVPVGESDELTKIEQYLIYYRIADKE